MKQQKLSFFTPLDEDDEIELFDEEDEADEVPAQKESGAVQEGDQKKRKGKFKAPKPKKIKTKEVLDEAKFDAPVDLPRSQVVKVMKRALPDGARVDKAAGTAMIEAVRLFIHNVTAVALECRKKGTRLLKPESVIDAVRVLEFGWMLPGLTELLDSEVAARNEKKKRKKAASVSSGNAPPEAADNAEPSLSVSQHTQPTQIVSPTQTAPTQLDPPTPN